MGMGNGRIGAIIGREFNYHVRRRSFIIGTILMPLLMVGLMVAPILLTSVRTDGEKVVVVIDRSGQIAPQLHGEGRIRFEPTDRPLEEVKTPGRSDIYGILVIGADIESRPSDLTLYTYGPSTPETESAITRQVREIIEAGKLRAYEIDNLPQIMREIETPVSLQAFRVDETGGERASSSLLSMGSAYLFGFLVYLFVFMYGAMVLQGVIEEKSSKVLEIMVSSVRPFELMMGKIVGIGLVAVTQFLIWMVLIAVLGTVALHLFAGPMAAGAGALGVVGGGVPPELANVDPKALAALRSVTDLAFLGKLFGGFIAYFVGGYLLYAAMFAAVGSAVDNVQDAQQLQVPITVPLLLSMIVLFSAMNDPQGPIAFWFSMIPFTSPIIMMARIPYGVPAWEVALSLVLLYASFVAMVWVASKIYRVGIFMYGKKPTLREMCKWIKYKY